MRLLFVLFLLGFIAATLGNPTQPPPPPPPPPPPSDDDDDDDGCSACEGDSCKVLQDVKIERVCVDQLCIDGHRACPSDGDPCTQDEWDEHVSACVHVQIHNCCTRDSQCVNKLASEFELACVIADCNIYNNQCEFNQNDGCCVEASDCPPIPCETAQCVDPEESQSLVVRKRNVATGLAQGEAFAHKKRFIPSTGKVCEYTRRPISECCLNSQECCENAGVNQIGFCDKNCTCQYITQIPGECGIDSDCTGKVHCQKCQEAFCWRATKTDPGFCECRNNTDIDEDEDGIKCMQDCDDKDPTKQSIHMCCPNGCDNDHDQIPQCGTKCKCFCSADQSVCSDIPNYYDPCDADKLHLWPYAGCEGRADGFEVKIAGGQCDHCDDCPDSRPLCRGDTTIWCGEDRDNDGYHKCNSTRAACVPLLQWEEGMGPFTEEPQPTTTTPAPIGRKRTQPTPPPQTTTTAPPPSTTTPPVPQPPPGDRCFNKLGFPWIEIENGTQPAHECEECDDNAQEQQPQVCWPDPNSDGMSVCFNRTTSRADQIACCRAIWYKVEHDLITQVQFENLLDCCEDLLDDATDDDDDDGGQLKKKRFWGYHPPRPHPPNVNCSVVVACTCPDGFCPASTCGDAECEGKPDGSFFHTCYADWDNDTYIACEKRKVCSTQSNATLACRQKGMRHINDTHIAKNDAGVPICDCNDECRRQNRRHVCLEDFDDDGAINCTKCNLVCVEDGHCPGTSKPFNESCRGAQCPFDSFFDVTYEIDFWNAHQNDTGDPSKRPPTVMCKVAVPPVECSRNQTECVRSGCEQAGNCDCCDRDKLAEPGSAVVSLKETACGGHDYNCDNRTESFICCNETLPGQWHWNVQQCRPLSEFFTKHNDSCGACDFNFQNGTCDTSSTCFGWHCSDHCALQGGGGKKRLIIEDCPQECDGHVVPCVNSQNPIFPQIGQCADVVYGCSAHPNDGKCEPEERCCARAAQ